MRFDVHIHYPFPDGHLNEVIAKLNHIIKQGTEIMATFDEVQAALADVQAKATELGKDGKAVRAALDALIANGAGATAEQLQALKDQLGSLGAQLSADDSTVDPGNQT